MNILENEVLAARTTTSFKMNAGQTLSLNFSTAGSVNVEYRNGDNWILLETIIVTSSKVASGNMIVRLVITANTGEIDAEIL